MILKTQAFKRELQFLSPLYDLNLHSKPELMPLFRLVYYETDYALDVCT